MSELEERTAAFNVEIREGELGDEKCVVDMADNNVDVMADEMVDIEKIEDREEDTGAVTLST